MKKTALILLLASGPVWAETPSNPETGLAKANAVATGGSATGGSAAASTGEITNNLTGGPTSAIAKSGDADSESTANNSLVSNEENPRQAPAIAVLPPTSTAAGLKCFGWAISFAEEDEAGAGGFGHCWKQRDDWAKERAEFMAAGGEYDIAAKEYCSKPFHRGPFPGANWRERRDNCETTVARMYYLRANPAKVPAEVPVEAPVVVSVVPIEPVACPEHSHKENEKGYMVYDNKTYVNVDKAFSSEPSAPLKCD